MAIGKPSELFREIIGWIASTGCRSRLLFPRWLSDCIRSFHEERLLARMRLSSWLRSPYSLLYLMTVAVSAVSSPLGADERAPNPYTATSKEPSVLYSTVPGCTLSCRSRPLRSSPAHVWLSPRSS